VTIFSVVSLGGFDKRFCGEASKARLVSCYMTLIYANSWEDFSRKAFLHLGRVLTVEEIEALKKRAVNLAMEVVENPDVQMATLMTSCPRLYCGSRKSRFLTARSRKLQGALIHAGRPGDAMPLEEALSGGLTAKALKLWLSRASVREELQRRVTT
jgi:hypothetical protein